MSDRSDRGKAVADRMSRRFAGDEDDADAERADGSDDGENAEHDEHGEDDQRGERSRNVRNVKEEWNGTYVYLPDDIDGPLDAEFDRLVYECGRDLDWKPKKNRHYYPVVVADGIETVSEMDPEAFAARLEELNLR
ncbi:hypothetical protein ACFO0N_20945 [Halobium salinum]|uniref:DUF8160 domain-containing protein n=1 Tax=Halobium salinum TaxID=1364940 RepID=A0ABD5PI14_9EURY|nr:hypothetical protein [Halobium salinum]